MTNPITVEVTLEEILKKKPEEKTDELIKIVFATYERVMIQHKIIFGSKDSPEDGLCSRVAFHDRILRWVAGGVSVVTIIGAIIKLVFEK